MAQMVIDAYLANLALLVVLISGAIYARSRGKLPGGAAPGHSVEAPDGADKEGHDGPDTSGDLRFRAFRNRFLRVYVLAVAADWLQVWPNSTRRRGHNSSCPRPSNCFCFRGEVLES